MECIEARALKKSSFLSESAFQQSLIDDFIYVNGVINGVSNDDFSVDVFLNLSNGDFDGELAESEEEEKESLSTSFQEREEKFSGAGESNPLPVEDLSVPVDDLENLEWLSQFVDDSGPELSLLCPARDYYVPKTETTDSLHRFKPPVHTHTPVLCFPSTVPAKARTKRPRTGGRFWSGGSSESSGESSPTSTLIFSNPAWDVCRAGFENSDGSEEVAKPLPAKRGRKRPATEDGSGDSLPPVQRRCSHCQVQKTPQWRNGPRGPKTLCNACGVRFKSGRLFPEYRPACSPTFSGDVHSNSHRKVLEMRKKKDVTVTGDESGLVM